MPSGNPGTNLCPRSQFEQPVFDGTQSYYNSGWLDSGQKWSVHLSSTTSVGTYRFMCLLHREDMAGKITVAPASKTIMSPTEQYALGVNQLAKAAKPLEPALAALRQGQPPIPNLKLPGENPVLAGSGAPNSDGSIDEFGLKTEKIPVGGSVTWWIIGPHSITFNSDKTNNDIRAVAPDGTVHFNPTGARPCGRAGRAAALQRRPQVGDPLQARRVIDLERLRVPQLGRLPELVRPTGDRGLQAHVHEGGHLSLHLHGARQHEGHGGGRGRLAPVESRP